METKVLEQRTLAVIGLGYVGLPLAVAFAKKQPVIGFDLNIGKIKAYQAGKDVTCEVGDQVLQSVKIGFTADRKKIREAEIFIIAVPTPVFPDLTPDLTALRLACQIVGSALTKKNLVVFESTVYPGTTEDICIPILEEISGMKVGKDFKVGYSPERINPGDCVHRLETIVKIVSGVDSEALAMVAKLYQAIVPAGIYQAESIKVAEAAKVIENSQRDINIAFMNELSIIFNRMGINTHAVLRVAATKWNFLPFTPGLVGGHCIGVDPYYLTYRAEQLGYRSQIITAGRRINDSMGKYVAENTVKNLIKADLPIKGAKVAILGITFKENCPDMRNSKVINVINELKEFGINPYVIDPLADPEATLREYRIQLSHIEDLPAVDAVIVAVAHRQFCSLTLKDWEKLYSNSQRARVFVDVKGIFDPQLFIQAGYEYWSL